MKTRARRFLESRSFLILTGLLYLALAGVLVYVIGARPKPEIGTLLSKLVPKVLWVNFLLIAFGATTRASRAAALELRKRGVRAGVLQLITLWPFADKEVALLGGRAKTIIVPEMNYGGQIAGEVQKVLGSGADIRRINSYNGEIITPQDILKAIR